MRVELSCPADNGRMNRIKGLFAGHGIHLLASSPFREGQFQPWLVVVDDGLRAVVLLHEAGVACEAAQVLLIEAPCQPVLLAQLGTALRRHGIAIHHTYFLSANGQRLAAVFNTANARRAFEILLEAAREINHAHQ